MNGYCSLLSLIKFLYTLYSIVSSYYVELTVKGVASESWDRVHKVNYRVGCLHKENGNVDKWKKTLISCWAWVHGKTFNTL